jgi:hypothetical protein
MSPIINRMEYLNLADMDYLSARLLILNGLLLSGMPKAAESIEKLIKLYLMLESKINKGIELNAKQLKAYGHNLEELFEAFKKVVPLTFDQEWSNYFSALQESYKNRYPDAWSQSMKWETDVQRLDICYSYLRANIVENFPAEELDQARIFGGAIISGYSPELLGAITKNGGMPPLEILKLNNKSIANFKTA